MSFKKSECLWFYSYSYIWIGFLASVLDEYGIFEQYIYSIIIDTAIVDIYLFLVGVLGQWWFTSSVFWLVLKWVCVSDVTSTFIIIIIIILC